jgi:hypothetical protein
MATVEAEEHVDVTLKCPLSEQKDSKTRAPVKQSPSKRPRVYATLLATLPPLVLNSADPLGLHEIIRRQSPMAAPAEIGQAKETSPIMNEGGDEDKTETDQVSMSNIGGEKLCAENNILVTKDDVQKSKDILMTKIYPFDHIIMSKHKIFLHCFAAESQTADKSLRKLPSGQKYEKTNDKVNRVYGEAHKQSILERLAHKRHK